MIDPTKLAAAKRIRPANPVGWPAPCHASLTHAYVAYDLAKSKAIIEGMLELGGQRFWVSADIAHMLAPAGAPFIARDYGFSLLCRADLDPGTVLIREGEL